jgi:hypothetical protein
MPVPPDDPSRLARRADWARGLAAMELGPIHAAFRAAGAPEPQFVWAPHDDMPRGKPNRFLLAHWKALRGADELPQSTRVDPAALAPALGYVNLVEPNADFSDFRYRVHGTHTAHASDGDLTGQLASQLPASDYVTDFTVAVMGAACLRREPLLSWRVPVGTTHTRGWEMVILPMAGTDGGVRRLLVGSVPFGEGGRMLRATF